MRVPRDTAAVELLQWFRTTLLKMDARKRKQPYQSAALVALDPRPIKRRPDVANKPSKALSPEVIVIDDDDDDVNVPAASARATIGIQRSSAADAPAADLAAASQIPLPAPHALLVAAKPAPSHAARNPLPAESAPQPSGSTCSTVHCAPTAAAAHGAGLGVCTSVASSCGGAPAAGVAASGAAGAVAPASSGGSAEAQAQPLPVRGGVRYDDPTLDCYVNDMYSYYAQREELRARPGYMKLQPHINDKMRGILVDWLVDVHLKYRQSAETLHLTVSIADRFLQTAVVQRPRLQLVGVAAMLIASKYEQCFRYEVRVEEMVYICDKTYTAEEVRAMEAEILKALSFSIGLPTAYTFLVRLLSVARAGDSTRHAANFVLEKALVEYASLEHAPSKLAAAALDMALRATEGHGRGWCPVLQALTGYSAEGLADTVAFLEGVVLGGKVVMPTLKAVSRKYSHAKYLEVATAAPIPTRAQSAAALAAAAAAAAGETAEGCDAATAGSSPGERAPGDTPATVSSKQPLAALPWGSPFGVSPPPQKQQQAAPGTSDNRSCVTVATEPVAWPKSKPADAHPLLQGSSTHALPSALPTAMHGKAQPLVYDGDGSIVLQ